MLSVGCSRDCKGRQAEFDVRHEEFGVFGFAGWVGRDGCIVWMLSLTVSVV